MCDKTIDIKTLFKTLTLHTQETEIKREKERVLTNPMRLTGLQDILKISVNKFYKDVFPVNLKESFTQLRHLVKPLMTLVLFQRLSTRTLQK